MSYLDRADSWNFDEYGNEYESDEMLPHLEDQEILGLADGYDDPRIYTLCFAYVKLRRRLTL